MTSNNPTDDTHLECDDSIDNQSREQMSAIAQNRSHPRLNSSVAHSPLFRLSPELRNEIHRLVMVNVRVYINSYVDLEPIMIDKDNGIPEPALLLSNKIIRFEASGIFYNENDFECSIHNLDPAPVLLLQSKLKTSFRDHGSIFISRSERMWGAANSDLRDSNVRWNNLVPWLHMCHEGRCPGLYDDSPYDVHPDLENRNHRIEAELLSSLFDVAKNCPEISSKALDYVINSMRNILGSAILYESLF